MKYFILFSLFLALSCTQDNASSSSNKLTVELNNNWFQETAEVAKDLFLKNYYVVLDGSGSMDSYGCSGEETKEIVAKKALISFSQELPESANLGLLVFDADGITERVPLGKNNRSDFIKKVKQAGANSGTPLKTAITKAVSNIEMQAGKQLGYGEYHLVVVTDGAADFTEDPTSIIQYIVQKTPIIVHTIGFCIGEDHSLNKEGYTIYKSANNPKDLTKGLQEVMAESEEFSVSDFKE